MSQSTSVLQQFSDALIDVTARAARSVVAVHSPYSHASGFIWRPGLIVTADEALAEEGDIAVVLPNGETTAATLVGRDPGTDIALLKIEHAQLAPVAFDPAAVAVGALALVVGSRHGVATSASGIVSFVGEAWRSLRGGELDARIELNLSLPRDGEGGLAVDASGRVFGMAVFGPRRRVLVIPAATIERVAGKLQTHGRVPRGYLGLGLQPARLDGEDGVGIMVMSVAANGPGAAAGMHQGDVIVQWNDTPIRGLRALLRSLGPDSVGTTVVLSVRRGGEPTQINLTIGERPDT